MLVVLMLDGLLSLVGDIGVRYTDQKVLAKKQKFANKQKGEWYFPEVSPQYHASPITAELARAGYTPAIKLGEKAYKKVAKHMPPRR